MSLQTIEQLAKEHAHYREVLSIRVRALHDEIEEAKRRKLPGIKAAVSQLKDSYLRLHAAIDSERELFAKPKTRVLHGIKLGLMKAKGKLRFADPAQVVKLIRKHFAERAEVLIKTKESPVREALLALPAADLKKIGCTVEDTGDQVIIKAADSEIDKLVDALLGERKELEDAEEAA